jgi:hypothetical protein
VTYAKYGPRTNVHPTRHGVHKTTRNALAVLHTSEGGELTSSAEALSRFMETPRSGTNLASYNVVFDTDQVIPAVPYDVVPYAAGGGNAIGVHGCFPGRAGQTREQWLDDISFDMIGQAARWLLDVHEELGIPLVRITWQQVQNGASGICDHFDISRAFKKSNHTDVGAGFPWDVLFDEIYEISNESKPDEKPTTPTIDPKKDKDMIALDLGVPMQDSWWTRMTYCGDTLTHVVSPADQLQERAKIEVTPIKEPELQALLKTVQTVGPSPFYEGGQAPNSALHVAWEQARGRT